MKSTYQFSLYCYSCNRQGGDTRILEEGATCLIGCKTCEKSTKFRLISLGEPPEKQVFQQGLGFDYRVRRL